MTYTAAGDNTGTIVSGATAVASVVSDPYFPEVTKLILRLRSLEKHADANKGVAPIRLGVGLRNVVAPLRLYVDLQERPWILPVTVMGVFGLVFYAGYSYGSKG